MHARGLVLLLAALLAQSLALAPAPACCPAPPSGKPVVNADQTVILLWDPATKTEHFIRQASFKADADDFGFLVPSPSKPQLDESGNDAFPHLQKLTEPEHKKMPRPSNVSCGCGGVKMAADRAAPGGANQVTVLDQKRVAGFDAVVLEASDAEALVGWLKDHGYAFSPQVKAWAKPYIDDGWKITALKVARDKKQKADNTVAASSLRISFKTDRPLFPYREPDPETSAKTLGATHRLLRIYFIADARFRGELTRESPWTGKVAWADKIKPEDRTRTLALLKLPETTGPAEWWMTEFEDDWPYRAAPADVYFSRDTDQHTIHRPPIIEYVAAPYPTDATVYVLAALLLLMPLVRRFSRAS